MISESSILISLILVLGNFVTKLLSSFKLESRKRSCKLVVTTSLTPGSCPLNIPDTDVAAATVIFDPSSATAVILLRLVSVVVPPYET